MQGEVIRMSDFIAAMERRVYGRALAIATAALRKMPDAERAEMLAEAAAMTKEPRDD